MMNIDLPSKISNDVTMFVLQPKDVTSRYVEWLNDKSITTYMESRFLNHTIESTRDFVESSLCDENTLLIGLGSHSLNMRHVGNIKLSPIDFNHGIAEVGILIGEKEIWGKGFAVEAINNISNLAKNRMKLRKLTAGCYASNLASKKAFMKAGFHVEGIRKDHYMVNENLEDLVLMARFL